MNLRQYDFLKIQIQDEVNAKGYFTKEKPWQFKSMLSHKPLDKWGTWVFRPYIINRINNPDYGQSFLKLQAMMTTYFPNKESKGIKSERWVKLFKKIH